MYVPAQYDATNPASLMVFQDGRNYARVNGNWKMPVVFDNLIHSGEMPVTIAVCVNPGVVEGGEDAQDRFNRSLEYDTVSDRYATFLIDELLPIVAKKYSITEDPNLRGIAGSSSGAIAAFGVAWHRPDQFRRVFSTVGTFVGLRGGNEFPTLIRKCEPKPLRVFLQDGRNDLDIYGGSWWNANQTMLASFQWAGYDVNHQWGDGGHNGKHGSALFPDAMRWLWKDLDQPIRVNTTDHPELKDRTLGDENWELVSEGHRYTEGPAVAPDGNVYFVDGPKSEIWKIDRTTQKSTLFLDGIDGVSGLMFDKEGSLFCARNKAKRLTMISANQTQTDIMSGMSCNDLVVLDKSVYFTSPDESAICYIPKDGKQHSAVIVGKGPEKPNGIIVTPDKRFLLVVDAMGRYVWSYRIVAPGKLDAGQPYHYVHLPEDKINTGADGMTMTRSGELLVASDLGVQVFDQPGRAHVILARPTRKGRLSNLVFAGDDFSTLYATCGSRVYRRKVKMIGIAPWQKPTVPEKPRL